MRVIPVILPALEVLQLAENGKIHLPLQIRVADGGSAYILREYKSEDAPGIELVYATNEEEAPFFLQFGEKWIIE